MRTTIRCYLLIGVLMFAASAAFAAPNQPAAETKRDDGLAWHDLRELEIEGRGWTDTKAFYDRLPAKAEAMVRPPVWTLSRQSAGICARFKTDAQAIHARWTLTNNNLAMPHMAATGVSGIDLYVKLAGQWRWLGIGQAKVLPTNTTELTRNLPPGEREYLVYLPLYNGVSSVEIGVERGRTFAKADPRPAERSRPIVFYGTSITQGGCAARPGMVHTAIIGRRFDWPVINLGFSGNGKMDPELATLLAEIDATVYVLDCLPNMTPPTIDERVVPFVKKLRKARPETPILLVEDRTNADAVLRIDRQVGNAAKRAALKKAYTALESAGVMNLHYLKGDKLLGDDNEGTVDGSHPTDLGFMRQADALEAALRPILAERAARR